MNKDVLYIEPEDDITTVITKIKNAKERIVAIVPPKVSNLLHSTVNLRLIAKTSVENNKVSVIITGDESLQKIALSQNIPVANNLKSQPILPNDQPKTDNLKSTEPSLSTSEEPTNAIEPKKSKKLSINIEENDSESIDKKDSEVKQLPNFKKYQKPIIAGVLLLGIVVGGIIWATQFAPSAKIAVKVRTTANNFSENVKFSLKSNEEDIKEGIFALEQQKLVKTSSVKFKATGQKNLGEKAKGSVRISADFTPSQVSSGQGITIKAGTKFTYDKKDYESLEDVTLSASKNDVIHSCENGASFFNPVCTKSTKINIVATESGEKYNLGEHTNGWSSSDRRFTIRGNSSISGGTDKIVTVVQESDIKKAKELLASNNESEGKKELFSKIPSGLLSIDATFTAVSKDPVSEPAVDIEVKEDTEPELKAETIFTVYVIDKVRVEEFIKHKSADKIADDQKIYEFGSPFIERFTIDDSKKYHSTAKIKTTTETGPKITETDIMEKSKGRKVGEVQSLIKSINGVSTVDIEVPYFWVRSIPDDPNKISIDLSVEK